MLNSDLTLALFVHECYYLAGDEEKTPNDPDLPHETPGRFWPLTCCVCMMLLVCLCFVLKFGIFHWRQGKRPGTYDKFDHQLLV